MEIFTHHLCAAFNGLYRRLRLHIINDPPFDFVQPQLQLMDRFVDDPQLKDRFIAHKAYAVHTHHVAQVADSVWLEIGFRRDFEPLHIIVPSCNTLDIDQIDSLDIP